jgi:hypothetical protein
VLVKVYLSHLEHVVLVITVLEEIPLQHHLIKDALLVLNVQLGLKTIQLAHNISTNHCKEMEHV